MNSKFNFFFNLKFLLLTNFISLILIIILLITEDYPNRILNRLQSINSTELNIKNIVSQNELSKMNNTFQPVFTDFSKGNSNKIFKVLIIGNSLTSHSIAKNIGWNHVSGMAATSLEKDYVHQLLTKISKELPNKKIKFRVTNFAEFERNPNISLENKLDSLKNFKADIVIFQLGENVDETNLSLFQKKYTELIIYFKKNNNAEILCTTPFFPSLRKNNMATNVTINTNSYLVDLSHLSLLDKENIALNEKNYQGDKTKWEVSGIGEHPGDKGMKSIAEQLFVAINTIISRQQSD